MTPFAYSRSSSAAEAILHGAETGAKFLGGGTNLVDLMREGIEQPRSLVDVSGLSSRIALSPAGSLMIGAAATNTEVASHPDVRSHFALLSDAILNGASGQIRNMATVGGNLLQRTRCLYFYDEAARCNKRVPGNGCDARNGHNRTHAILGASEHCVATHPSDMCVALSALGATVHIAGPGGERTINFTEFHRLPGDTPNIETALRSGELITAVEVEPQLKNGRARYRKVRERASYAFALVSVGAILAVEDGTVRGARIALGGVAHKPWRANASEEMLVGAPATIATFERAASAALHGAKPLQHNAFKVDLAQRVIVATLAELAESGAER